MDNSRIITPSISIGTIISIVIAAVIVIAFLLSLIIIIIGIIQFALNFRKDKPKSNSARKRVLIGIGILIITVIFFVTINVIITAMAPPEGPGTLRIPTQKEFQNTNPQ